MPSRISPRWLACGLAAVAWWCVGPGSARGQEAARPAPAALPSAERPEAGPDAAIPLPPSILGAEVRDLDLNTALRLAGVENPELNLARQRVVEAVAIRQLAAAQILPTINYGFNYDSHTGPLQQSNGNILSVALSHGPSRWIDGSCISRPGSHRSNSQYPKLGNFRPGCS